MKGLSLINDYKRNITYGKIYEVVREYEESYLIISDENKEELISKDSIILATPESFNQYLLLMNSIFVEMENYTDIDKSDMYEIAKNNFLSLIGCMEILK